MIWRQTWKAFAVAVFALAVITYVAGYLCIDRP